MRVYLPASSRMILIIRIVIHIRVFDFFTGLFAPGLVGIAMGFLILFGVKDSPESAGFPSVEGGSSKTHSIKDEESSKTESQKESLLDLLVNDCLKYV